MSWKDKLFELIGKRFISKEEYFNENGHRPVLINCQYIAVLKSECPSNTVNFDIEYNEYYISIGKTQIYSFYLHILPYSVKHVYQCHGVEEEGQITNNSTTIDISSSIGYFNILLQEEI